MAVLSPTATRLPANDSRASPSFCVLSGERLDDSLSSTRPVPGWSAGNCAADLTCDGNAVTANISGDCSCICGSVDVSDGDDWAWSTVSSGESDPVASPSSNFLRTLTVSSLNKRDSWSRYPGHFLPARTHCEHSGSCLLHLIRRVRQFLQLKDALPQKTMLR